MLHDGVDVLQVIMYMKALLAENEENQENMAALADYGFDSKENSKSLKFESERQSILMPSYLNSAAYVMSSPTRTAVFVTRFTQVYPDFAVFFVEFYADLDTNALF